MTNLYSRSVRVTLWYPKNDAYFSQPDATNGVQIDDLKIEFSIDQTLEKNPNQCRLTITNLAPDTRAFVERKPCSLKLEAGYSGNLATLFIGDVRYAKSKLDGVNWTTEMELADGGRAFTHARVGESFRSGTDIRTVIQRTVDSFGLTLSTDLSDSTFDSQYIAGKTLHGKSTEVLTRLLKPIGYTWSIQRGQLQILQPKKTDGRVAYVVDSDNGLIGSPETAAPEKKGKAPVTTVTTLLDPRLYPGARVQLKSAALSATLKLSKVQHAGCNLDGDFKTTFEGVPV